MSGFNPHNPRRKPRKGFRYRWEVHARYPGFAGLVDIRQFSFAEADMKRREVDAAHGDGSAWLHGPVEEPIPR